MKNYMRLLHFVAVTVLAGGAGVPLLQGDGFNGVTLVAVIGAVAVWFKGNSPTAPRAKFLVAGYVAAAAVLVAAYTDQHVSAVEWQQIILAALGAGTVLGSRNAYENGVGRPALAEDAEDHLG